MRPDTEDLSPNRCKAVFRNNPPSVRDRYKPAAEAEYIFRDIVVVVPLAVVADPGLVDPVPAEVAGSPTLMFPVTMQKQK